MAKITQNVVLKGEYPVEIGNEYEITAGNFGTLKAPTVSLQKKVFDKFNEDKVASLDLAKMVLTDLKEVNEDDVLVGMPERVLVDFFTLLRKMTERLTQGSNQLLPSEPLADQK